MRTESIVQDYQHPQPGATSTFTIDERVQREIQSNGIAKPKGYTVSYHGNSEVEKMHFGPKHPMKPWRLTLTNKIVMAYGMHEAMDLYMSRAATNQELTQFHKQEYIDFLQRQVIQDHENLVLATACLAPGRPKLTKSPESRPPTDSFQT